MGRVRQAILLRSVERHLGPGERVEVVAYLWSRHRLMVPYAAVAGVGVGLLAAWVGFDTWSGRVGLGAAAAVVAALATTEHRILARTERGLAWLRCGRFRQVATGLIDRLGDDVELVRKGGTPVTSDWEVRGIRYTVPKRFGPAMEAMARRSD